MTKDVQSPEAILEALKAKRLAMEEARKARLEADAVHQAIAAETRAIADAEALEAAEAEWNPKGVKLAQVSTSEGSVIFRQPKFGEFKKFQDADPEDPEASRQAVTKLVYTCCVYPSHVELGKIIDALPAVQDEFLAVVATLAGSARAKKLLPK